MENHDRDLEQRMYFVLREDIEISLEDCALFGAIATARLTHKSSQEAPERFAHYGRESQPKICLRAKNIGQLEKAYQEAKTFQAIKVHDANDEFIGIAFGPLARNEMTKGLTDLQIFKEFKASKAFIRMPTPNLDLPILLLGIRQDLEIPAGKLVAQAGHGVFASIENGRQTEILDSWKETEVPNIAVCYLSNQTEMTRYTKMARQNKIPNAYIVDAGRTVFNEPTPTLVGIGPLNREDLSLFDCFNLENQEMKNGI